MKAAQRFMRPVKEIREGFFTFDDDHDLMSSNRSAASSMDPHAVSATRHFVEQYRRRAADAGLLSSRSVGSRLSSPRSSMPTSSRALSSRKSLPASDSLSARALEPTGSSDLPSIMWLQSAQSGVLQGAASLSHHQPV